MLDKNYWNNTYDKIQPGWDVGYAATPLKEYFNQIDNKTLRILIPGAGNAYEVEYLYKSGFKNVFLLDFAPAPVDNFRKRNPEFPEAQIITEDFFDHKGRYDLIIEHTFLTSFPKSERGLYASKINDLLVPGGKFTGIVFNHEFPGDHPPYGGTAEEYKKLFRPFFHFKTFELCYNSIKPRRERELFFILIKK